MYTVQYILPSVVGSGAVCSLCDRCKTIHRLDGKHCTSRAIVRSRPPQFARIEETEEAMVRETAVARSAHVVDMWWATRGVNYF